MKEFLRKQYGPFTGGIWVVVIVGGVGLGLVMRRFMGAQGGDPAPATAAATADFGTETGSPAFVGGGGTTLNQGSIVNDVLDAIQAQEPPPGTTDPAELTSLEQQIAGLKAQHTRLTELMNQRAEQRRGFSPPQNSTQKRHVERLNREIDEMRLARDKVTQQISDLEAQLSFVGDRI